MRKIVNLPLPIHLCKFIIASVNHDFLRSGLDYGQTKFLNKEIECLKVVNYIPMARRHLDLPQKWMANIPPTYEWIAVEMEDPTIPRLYYLYKFIEAKFNECIVEHMHIEKLVDDNARKGLHKFLDKCDISEEDYKVATGYKHWQRYQNKLKKKKQAYAA